jgi:glucose/arabinose dehydrogenase
MISLVRRSRPFCPVFLARRHPLAKQATRAGFAIGAALLLAGCDDQAGDPSTQYGSDPKLPAAQQYLLPPMKVMPSRGWASGDTPTAAQGLRVEAIATGLLHPRIVYPLPNGDILVVESNGPKAPIYRPKDFIEGKIKALAGSASPGGQRISILQSQPGSQTAKTRHVLIDHLNAPYGVVLVGNDLYVADTDALLRFPYKPGETSIATPGVKLTDLPAQSPNHHWTKSLTASPDGSKLYVGVGSNSNITENGIGAEEGRAAVWEIDRQTDMKREFATGLRNPTGLAFEPTTGKLWAIANERDEIGPDLVPDYLTEVKENAFYGWPYSYWGQNVDVRAQPQRPDLVAKAIKPDYGLGSHVAPLGLVFSQSNSLSPHYGPGVFIGEHGSWDRDPPVGYKVVFIPFQNGRPNGPPQDVVTGFVSKDGYTNGRPVGVALDRTGALLVADDAGNTVWRVSSVGSGSASRE